MHQTVTASDQWQDGRGMAGTAPLAAEEDGRSKKRARLPAAALPTIRQRKPHSSNEHLASARDPPTHPPSRSSATATAPEQCASEDKSPDACDGTKTTPRNQIFWMSDNPMLLRSESKYDRGEKPSTKLIMLTTSSNYSGPHRRG